MFINLYYILYILLLLIIVELFPLITHFIVISVMKK